MRLLIPILLNCLLVLAVYLTDKYTPAKKMPYMAKQAIIGLLFGAVSAFSSSFGVELLGTMVNVRDAAPLSAGLIFGGPAGVIAGLIGGIYRWFSVYWGGGEYTRLACTIATILAGLMAAGLRRLMFDNKKPTWGYGICITVVCEVIHMLLIFLTNMDDSAHAFDFVRGATIPMILGNTLAVGLSIVFVSLLSHERLTRRKGTEQIAQTFQRWLLACIVIAYLITGTFTYILQNGMAKLETQEIFTSAINDVQTDVRGKSHDHMLALTQQIIDQYRQSPELPLDQLAQQNGVTEIHVVSQEGLILHSSQPELEGSFNLNSTAQSQEFMVLTQGQSSFVQEYGPVGFDGTTMRKYAGVALPEGGFIQVGYSTEQFRQMLDTFVVDVTKNRHVGSEGFVAVCDENLNLITHNDWNGRHISDIGIIPNEQMEQRLPAQALCHATVVDEQADFQAEYIYVFTFVEGYGIVAAMPLEEAMFMRDASLYNSMFMQVLIFATLFVFIYILIKRVIINNLKKINSTLAQITEGNLNVTVDVRSNAEFASLSDDINTTVTTLKRYIAEAAARIDKELEYAKQIQLSALPTDFPKNEDYSIYAQMIAAREVGGDFYDFYTLDENKVVFLVADVSGKGIPAAMFMMTAKTILKDLAERGLAVNEIFTAANEKLCENNESGMFVTAWMGILDVTTGQLEYANAGHNPPLLLKNGGSFGYLRCRPGFVLGGMEGVQYRLNRETLSPGDRLFLYTDGVPEATNEENCLYGEDRLQAFMDRLQREESTVLLPSLKADIDSFAGSTPQFDDITMLLLDYKPQKEDGRMTQRLFPAQIDCLDQVLGFVEQTLEEYGCAMKLQMALTVAIEEVFVNVAKYAYQGQEGQVRLEIGEAGGQLTFRIIDQGVPFDPLARPDPDITLSAEDRQIGGLGIFITKKTMDTVSYAYENGENILTMTKKL